MKAAKNRHNIRGKRRTVQVLAVSFMLLGILFSSINIVKFAKGYFAYHQGIAGEEAVAAYPGDLFEDNSLSTVKLTKEEQKAQTDREILYTVAPQTGDKIGELYIPKLDATLPIYQGTGEAELEKGVGHYMDSVLPGEIDNCVLSGHRDTVFRKLGEVGEGDSMIVRTTAGEFEYQISKVRIVDKDDKTVIVPKPIATLTVSTCYPFGYIGAAPERYVLVANLVSSTIK